MRRPLGTTAIAAFATMFVLQPVWAQRPPPRHPVFGHTLHQGTGFIATPHAFASEGEFFGTGTIVGHDTFDPNNPITFVRAAGGIALGDFIEVGGTVHNRGSYSAFGKIQLVRQRGVFPAIAAGVQNVGNSDIGRFGMEDPFYSDLADQASLYGVATYVVGPGGRNFASWVIVSAGWGSGIFEKDNPAFEEDDGTSGLFGAVAFDFQAAEEAFIRVVTEWDGFDLNLGVVAWLAGLQLTVGVLSADEGDAPVPQLPGDPLPFDPTRTRQGVFYNQAKAFASVTVDARALLKLPWIWTRGEDR